MRINKNHQLEDVALIKHQILWAIIKTNMCQSVKKNTTSNVFVSELNNFAFGRRMW